MEQKSKELARGVFERVLKKHGWPNMTNDQLMSHLPELWREMEKLGVTQPLERRGFGYAKFVQCATVEKQKSDMAQAFRDRFNDLFNR